MTLAPQPVILQAQPQAQLQALPQDHHLLVKEIAVGEDLRAILPLIATRIHTVAPAKASAPAIAAACGAPRLMKSFEHCFDLGTMNQS